MSAATQHSFPSPLDAAPRQRPELILAQIDQLPPLPPIALRAAECGGPDAADLRELAAWVEGDAALAACLGALAGADQAGARGAGASTSGLLQRLPPDQVRGAVFAYKVFETFAALETNGSAGFLRPDFWKHSLAVACAARLIAGAAQHLAPAEAFVGGLLHDVGKAALHVCLPKSWARAVDTAATRRACLGDIAREMFGVDHMTAGRRLATRWKLPPYVADCCWLHHDPPDALPPSLASRAHVEVVHLANHWVRQQRIGFSGCAESAEVAAAAERVGLTEGQLAALAPALLGEVERHAALIGLGDGLTPARGHTVRAGWVHDVAPRHGVAAIDPPAARRARCAETLARFTVALAVGDDLLDVCRRVADAARQAFDLPAAAAFALHPGEQLCTVVWASAAQSACDMIVPLTEPDGAVPPHGRTPGGELFTPAPAWTTPIVERLSGWADAAIGEPQTRAWLLPIAHAGERVGGVVCAAAPAVIEPFQRDPADLAPLAAAFGLALAGAGSRAQAARLHDELAAACRQLRRVQGRLVRARSLDMIAEMAAGAAHELNNPLAVICGRAQLLQADLDDPEQLRALSIITEQALRCSQIVSDLMAFAKPSPPSPVGVALATLLEEVGRDWLLRSSLDERQLTWRVADPAVQIHVDLSQIVSVLDALIANAVEATDPPHARIQINSDSRTSDETVVVRVEDNGCGMTPQVLEHALDPFFSHRSAGRGRGLGLSRAYRLAEINGGRLWLESTPTAGTKVFVELPARPR